MNQKAAREREALLKRLRELQEEIAQINQQSRAGNRLPPEEQFRINLERIIEMKMPHIAGKVDVEIVHPGANTAVVSADETQKPAEASKIKKILLQFGR